VSERYADFARAVGERVTYSRVDRTRGTSVSDCLLDFAEDAGADFITVGVDGLGRFAAGKSSRLGSTSDAVVRRARCNVLVAQEAGATFTLAESN
jgi:nucleotide-binding universal stress UspA family protein